MGSSPMEKIGECNGVTLYFADSRFERPGVYYWDGTDNVRVWPPEETAAQAEINALRAELARIEENGTPWVPELLEWLEKHDCCPEMPFTDYELIEALEARFGTKLYASPQPAADDVLSFGDVTTRFIDGMGWVVSCSDAMKYVDAMRAGAAVMDSLRAPNPPQPSASVGERASTHHVHRGPESLPCYCAATADHLIGKEASKGEVLARRFHEAYERLAPSFGYETRTETRKFDPTTPNGRLMIAVCEEIAIESALTTAAGVGGLLDAAEAFLEAADARDNEETSTQYPQHELRLRQYKAARDDLEAALGRGGSG